MTKGRKMPDYSGTLTIVEGDGPFVRDQTLHFEATWNREVRGRAPWVEVVVTERGIIPNPGGIPGVPVLAFYRDYDAPHSIVLGDQGGTSIWQREGYPPATGRASLYCYEGKWGSGQPVVFAYTDPFDID